MDLALRKQLNYAIGVEVVDGQDKVFVVETAGYVKHAILGVARTHLQNVLRLAFLARDRLVLNQFVRRRLLKIAFSQSI